MPLLGLNALVYIAFFIIAVVWFSVWTALAVLGTTLIHGFVGLFCFVIAVGFGGWIWRIARRYLLYLVKGAHIAAMTDTMTGRDVPGGLNQIKYGQEIIKKYFKDVSMLFGLDMLINGVVRALTGTVVNITNILPLPGSARKLLRVIRTIINRSLSYVDEAILSHAIRRREPNVWASARHGTILYAQGYKGILLNTAKIYVLGKVLDVVLFAVLLVPFLGIAALLDTAAGGFVFLAGLILAAIGSRLIELAFYEPFALAYVLVTYHRETEGLEPDPEWDQRLQDMSGKFREIVGKADSFTPEKRLETAESQ